MKKTNKLWLAMLLTVLVAALLAAGLTAAAEDPTVIASGYCGGEGDETNLSWTLDSEGLLTISGEGYLQSYGSDPAPWSEMRDSIQNRSAGSGPCPPRSEDRWGRPVR